MNDRFKPPTRSHPRLTRKCEKHGMQIAVFMGYGCIAMACNCQLRLNPKTHKWDFDPQKEDADDS